MNGDGTGRSEEPQRTHRSRTTGAALEAHYRFMLRLVPALERLPRSQKFLLGDRIEGTALEVLESLIEATYTRQRGNHLARANQGSVARDEVERRVRSWIAHAGHADSWRLRQAIFRGGWYDPAREGLAVPQSSGGVLRGGS